MASNTNITNINNNNNSNNVQHPPNSFITPISLSTNNTVNSINIDCDCEKNENQFSNPIPNKDNQQQQHQKQYVNYNITNNYAKDTNNIKLTTRKRHLSSSSNNSISSHTLINQNYNDNNYSNNPNGVSPNYPNQRNSYKPMKMTTETTTYTSTAETTIAATQNHSFHGQSVNESINNSKYSRNNSNNGIPTSLFYNSQNQNHSENNINAHNKNKKQKIEVNTKILQKQSLTHTIEKTIRHHQSNDQIIKRTHHERVDSLANDNLNNENNNMSNKEFDIPNSMNYIYTREVQPSLIQNYNEINNNNQIIDNNELNQKNCYYHNNTSKNNLNKKINFENESNMDKFLKFNTNINDSTSIAALKTMNNPNEITKINNINNTISIKNKNNLNKISTNSPTAVFRQTIEYPTSINVNVNTSISIPQVTTTTTIKPLIQNSTNLFSTSGKDNAAPITTTTTLIPYTFQTTNAPIATFSTVTTTTRSPKINSQNSENNGSPSPLITMEGLHVSTPYYQNIYSSKAYISNDYNNNNINSGNNNSNINSDNNFIIQKQGNNFQMGKPAYSISSHSNSPKSPIRQQANNIPGSPNKNVLFHSPLRNSLNSNLKPEQNNNVRYQYYKNNGPCYPESINDENNDNNNQNEMNKQQQMNYNTYYNSGGNIKSKKSNTLLKNITTNNCIKRNMPINQLSCNTKENISNLNMYIIEQNKDHNKHSQLPSPPLTGYEDSNNVHFDFMNNSNPNIYINDYKLYSNKAYPYNYSPVSPDKTTFPTLKTNDPNLYAFKPSQFNNDDVKVVDNNIIVNNMRIVSQNSPVNLDMMNMNLMNNNNSNHKEEILMNHSANIVKEGGNADVGEDKPSMNQANYYSDTVNKNKHDHDNNNGQMNNSFIKPSNKGSSPKEGNLPPNKKKFRADNEMNLSNNNNYKVIYSKKYSIGKISKYKNNNGSMLNQQQNIYPMNNKVNEEMIMNNNNNNDNDHNNNNNNKNENHNFHSQPSYSLPYTTTITSTLITSTAPNNALKAIDNNPNLITPVPIPGAIPNRKVNNVILNSNMVPLTEEIGNDSNGPQNQGSHQSKHQRKIMSSQIYQNSIYDVNSINMNNINRMYTPNKIKNIPPTSNGKSIILPPPTSMPVFVPMNIPININNNNNNLPITLSTPSPSSPPLIPINQQCSIVQQKSLQNNNYSLPIHYSSPCYPQTAAPTNINNSIPINTSPLKQSSNSNSRGNNNNNNNNQMKIQNPTTNYQVPNVNSGIEPNQNQNNMTIKRKHSNTKRIASGQEIISDDGSITWKILKQLGKGGCGEVYLAQCVSGKKQPYKYCAIKFIKNKKVFYAETSTMKYLMDNTACDYTPKIYSSCPKQRFLLMEYIQGENLTQKFESCGHYFSLKTMLMVLMELMRLTKEFYTSTGLVHVDIKPSNFMVDLKNKIYLIDFGYATAPNVKLPGQTGTPLFMSQAIQSQGTICPSFQDDIESIGYVMMYFLKGGKLGLPWGLFKTHSEIVAAKTDSNIYNFFVELRGTEYEPICNLLYNFLTVSRKRDIPFDEKDYNKLYDSILKVFKECGFVNDQQYDWNNVSKKA